MPKKYLQNSYNVVNNYVTMYGAAYIKNTNVCCIVLILQKLLNISCVCVFVCVQATFLLAG